MSRKVEQGDVTRGKLLSAAIELFTDNGFADTSTTQIVRQANVTRGALYHHFADKERLFEAAFVEVQREVFNRCAAASDAAGNDLHARMSAGINVFLDACLEPQVQRILLLEGPSLLGWQRSLRFDDPYCARRLLMAGLTSAAKAGLLPDEQAEPLTHLLYGALNQAGIVIAGAAEPIAERAVMGQAVRDLVDSLLRP